MVVDLAGQDATLSLRSAARHRRLGRAPHHGQGGWSSKPDISVS